MISDQADEVSEDVRLKYRYLDLRRPAMFETMKMRHEVTRAFRHFLDDHGFLDIETPILTKVRQRVHVTILCQAVYTKENSMRCLVSAII